MNNDIEGLIKPDLLQVYAKQHGIGELTPLEIDALIKHQVYDWWAENIQMPYDVAKDAGDAWQAMAATQDAHRTSHIQEFIIWLDHHDWCAHDWKTVTLEEYFEERICKTCGFGEVVEREGLE